MQYRPYARTETCSRPSTPARQGTPHRTHQNFAPGCAACDALADRRAVGMVTSRRNALARTMSQAYAR